MRVLLLTPPLTQLNTPYPATSYLAGFLRSRGIDATQIDLSLETALAVFSQSGVRRIFETLNDAASKWPEIADRALPLRESYIATIEPVVAFLQGRDPTLARRIAGGKFLPEGPRLRMRVADRRLFGSVGTSDRAKHLASLYLDDLSDLISATLDPLWGLSRYGERLAASASSFDPIERMLGEPPGFVIELMERQLETRTQCPAPDLVGITVPFPGNLYGALRAARVARRAWPDAVIALGGGYVNTELRDLREPRLFDDVDFVTLDAGERPLLCLVEWLEGRRERERLCRTFSRMDGRVTFHDGADEPDFGLVDVGTPTYRGLDLGRYLSIVEVPNPMHRLWSEGRWNKLTVAYGCYWKRCAFCDVSLDYIKRYDPASAAVLADRIDELIEETGQTGFHFVDEAAPPARLVDLALTLLERSRVISWWGNIRFEAAFTADVCRLLAASGCVAVSGGLETVSDRLLALMDKGITVAQAANAARAFRAAGIMVHAYLMYGFPTETPKETIDALERVRRLFAEDVIQSAYWHRFTATTHSPIGRNPSAFGITLDPLPEQTFARNDVAHRDRRSGDLDMIGEGLAAAVYHYMRGAGFDRDVRSWFARPMPRPRRSGLWGRVPHGRPGVATRIDPGSRVVWIEGPATVVRGRTGALHVATSTGGEKFGMSAQLAEWLSEVLTASSPRERHGADYPTIGDLVATCPDREGFARWSGGPVWRRIRRAGLLVL